MRIVIAILVAALFAASTPASAQVLDLSTVKCKDFVASGEKNISLILMWLQGYYSDQDDPPIVNFDKMSANATKLGEYCGKNPEVGLITAADEIMN